MENKEEITYRSVEGYRLPNLLPNRHPKVTLGSYARERRKYLSENLKATYTTLLSTGQLTDHLVQTEHKALELERKLTKQMAETEGLTEHLKESDPMEWVRRMNNIQSRAREIVRELVINV